MSYSEFYLDAASGGSDTNAGSTTGAHTILETNGDWDNAAANRFTAASGTPFSGVSVGDWASVYVDGATTAVYIAKVTVVVSGGVGVTLSAVNKMGTKPSASATGRSCKIGGAWTSMAVINSLFASVAAALSMRVNIKYNASAYAMTTTTLTIGSSGITTAPIMFRGYNTTIGDIESNNTLAKPTISWTTGQLIVSGSYTSYHNLILTGAQVTNGQVRHTGSRTWFHRCRLACTSANANGSAFSNTANNVVFTQCDLTSTASANIAVAGNQVGFIGCNFINGLNGISSSSGNLIIVAFCNFISQTGDACRATGATNVTYFLCNTVYAPTSDGFEQTVDPTTTMSVLFGNIFDSCGNSGSAYAINSSIGTNTSNIVRLANLFHASRTADENGISDLPAMGAQTDAASPFTAAGTDFSLVSTSNGKAKALPGTFENRSETSYLDIGAIQRAEPAAGGPVGNNMLGGFI